MVPVEVRFMPSSNSATSSSLSLIERTPGDGASGFSTMVSVLVLVLARESGRSSDTSASTETVLDADDRVTRRLDNSASVLGGCLSLLGGIDELHYTLDHIKEVIFWRTHLSSWKQPILTGLVRTF